MVAMVTKITNERGRRERERELEREKRRCGGYRRSRVTPERRQALGSWSEMLRSVEVWRGRRRVGVCVIGRVEAAGGQADAPGRSGHEQREP